MNDIRDELQRLAEKWAGDVPICLNHPGREAVAFCNCCCKPVCGSCLVPMPAEVRCLSCRSIAERFLPSYLLFIFSFLRTVLLRRWALSFVVTTAVFLGVIIFMPELIRPKPPPLPAWAADMKLQAPYLEKTFRLNKEGEMFKEAGYAESAAGCFRRAVTACEDYLSQVDGGIYRFQVLLGIGRLHEKLGDMDEAVTVYRSIINGSDKDIQAVGVAHYYLAGIYEREHENKNKALEHYRKALKYSRRDGDFIDKLTAYHGGDQRRIRERYSVAALTDTVTSPSAVHRDIADGIERCTEGGTDSGKARASTGPSGKTDQSLPVEEESLEIILGE